MIGRWLGVDPVDQFSTSPYAYAVNNPLIFVDPVGADTIRVHFPDGTTKSFEISDIVIEAPRQDTF